MGYQPSLQMTKCDNCEYTDVLQSDVECPMCEHGTMEYPE